MNRPLPPPLFDAATSLSTVLAWPGLPEVLRRALTRPVSPDILARVSIVESLRSPDPRFREWVVGLLALDIGVDFDEQRDNIIGVFSSATLSTAKLMRFCIHGVGPQQGYGASFRSPAPSAPATLCAAAYVYFTDTGLAESEFVFIAGPSAATTQLPLPLLLEEPLDESHIERALASVAGELVEIGNIDQTSAVLREALLECRHACVPRDRGQQ